MTNHEQEIKREVERFRKNVDKIRNSDNPIYKDKEVVDYEVKALRADLDAKVAELSNEFDASIDAQIADAEQKAKYSRYTPLASQKERAEHMLDSFVADVLLARDEVGKHTAVKKLMQYVDDEDMTPAELAHVRLQLPNALSRVNGDPIATKGLTSINEVLARLKTPEQERVDELKTIKRLGPAQAYSRLKLTHNAYKHLPTNQHSGHFRGTI